MSGCKQRALSLALAGAGILGMVDAAQAVSVNPRGLGEALIYPYYTVRETSSGASFNSLLSVTNVSDKAKAVKVRFLEGKRGTIVLDFHLYLSTLDVWTAAVIPTENGAAIFTEDTSCTQPVVPRSVASAQPFYHYGYSGGRDLADSSLDRTREGYIEIIEMGAIKEGSATEENVTHVNGVPRGCANLSDQEGGQTDLDTTVPTGGLLGSMTLVNPLSGLDIAYDATALDSFSQKQLWEPHGYDIPNLGSANPPVSVVRDGMKTYITDWSGRPERAGLNAVSAVLMQNTINNEYVTGGSAAARTDWVVTMPTKSLYYGSSSFASVYRPLELFQSNFVATGACDDLSLDNFDREERIIEPWGGLPPPTPENTICWQTNVITFGYGNESVFASRVGYTGLTDFEAGWLRIGFQQAPPQGGIYDYVGQPHQLIASGTDSTRVIDASSKPPTVVPALVTYTGLPVVGFAVQVFNNGTLATPSGKVNANYAGRLNHKGTVSIKAQ